MEKEIWCKTHACKPKIILIMDGPNYYCPKRINYVKEGDSLPEGACEYVYREVI